MKRIRSSSLIMVGLLVIGLLTWATPAASVDTPGVWKLTGSMGTSRRHSQYYPLPDGRILVVGGTDTTGVDGAASIFYATAEIYDPATGTWTATGSLTTGGRVLHTSTALPDGRILITGGWNGSAALSSAETYNPATGTSSATGSMTTARANHRQRILFDGRVLITGGFDSGGTPIASAEIYNPATGTFSATAGPMAAARNAHLMNTVGDGKVLITGGFGAGGAGLATAELFNPATGTFTAAGSLAHARAHHGATVLPTGEVLVTGGHGGGGVLGSTELYDPDTNTFTAGPTLSQARKSHSAQLLPNGLVLISGGNNNTSDDWDIQTNFLSSAELYDPATDTFTTTGSKTNATCNGNSMLLWTGKFLAAGGGTNEAELYTPGMPGAPETWVATGNMVTARTSHLWNLLDDGRVLMTGGLDSAGNPLASAELYDYLTGKFSSTGNMTIARQHHKTVLLYTGKVLVTGGRPFATTNVLNSAELYDPVSGTFTSTGNMVQFRRLHRATELRNGKILITGGLGGTSNTANSLLSTAELYDPATGTFTQTTGGLIAARRSHQAILLYTGKVLTVGGNGASSVLLNSAELYDPATNTFKATGNMITARSPLLTRLPNGKVLVSDGSDAAGTPIQALEIYDPATGIFTPAGNGLVARDGNRVTRMDNGKLIFVGGQTTVDATSVTNSAELYNHVTGRFSATGSLITGRQDFAQTSLPHGRVLVAGGLAAAGTVLSSAELYTPLIADEVDTTITSGPDALTNSTSATFNFTSTDPTSIFTCSLDGSAFVPCTSGQTYSSLALGSHNFQVHATDSLGNTDPTPANYDWTVDTTAPNTVIDTKPLNPTNLTNADFTFHSTESGSSFQCQIDGGGYSACTSPKNYTGLAAGDHTFDVKATDGAGNTDPTPASYNWTITPLLNFSMELYDDFSETYIDKTKWREGEWVREIDPGSQKLLLKQASPSPIEDDSNSLNFSDPNSVNSIQADVTILENNITNQASTRVRLAGRWYNDGTSGGGRTGDIHAEVSLRGGPTGLFARWAVSRFTNADGTTSTTLGQGNFTTPINLGATYTLYASYDTVANQFTFRVGTEEKTFGPGGLPTPVGYANNPQKTLQTRVQVDNSSSSGYVAVAFDNVYKNGSLYDNFSSPTIDPAKWNNYEFVREIDQGKLRSKVRSSSGSTSSNYSRLEFLDPSSTNLLQAKVMPLTYQNTQGADIIARMGGHYYNDGTPGGGHFGEIGAEVRIGGKGVDPVAEWNVWTYTDLEGVNHTNVASGTFTKPILLNNTYILFLGWDGSRFIFKFDDEVAHYTPVTNINPPNLPWKEIGTRVRNPVGKEAIIEALFDDVIVGAACCPAIDVNPQSIDFGKVLPGNTSDHTVIITNVGSVTLTLGTIGSPSAPFSITGGTCTNNQTLPPQGSCTLIIRFAPTAYGVYTSSFSIPSDDPVNSVVTVNPINGTGTSPDHFTLTISKSGTGNGTVTSGPAGINCGSDCTEDFKVGTKITLKSKADTNSTFAGWSGGGCSGTGTCAVIMNADIAVTAAFAAKTPDISIAQTSLDFGSVKVGKKVTKTLKIGNNGSGDLLIMLSGLEGTDFSIQGSSSVTIKAKKSYTLKVLFTPKSAGLKTATLKVESNDLDSPSIDISLSGTGQ